MPTSGLPSGAPLMAPTPPANYPATTLQVGTYTALSDTFTLRLDLNDRQTWFLHANGLKLDQPEKTFVRGNNVRTPGERIARFQYKNRHIQVQLWLGRNLTTPQIQAQIRALVAAIEQPPYVLRIALPGATQYSYADVVAVTHTIPADPQVILNGALTHVEINFECRPFFRGDRVTLQNLCANPGFEAPSGPPVQVFADPFTNANAYYTVGGSAPSVASNVLTIPAGTTLTFGSPNWCALNLWQVRFQLTNAGMNAYFFLHRKDASNDLHVLVQGTSFLNIAQTVGGAARQIASATPSPALTVGNWYWLQITQFPSVPGNPPYVQATLFNDTAGAVGSQISSIGGATYDAVTALSGASGFYAGNGQAMAVGGNYPNVHATYLFGPGGWPQIQNYGTGLAAGAWDTAVGNVTGVAPSTYPGGPVTSFGAARIDAAPAGTFSAFWYSYVGGSPAGTSAIAVAAAGNTLGVAVWAKSAGLGVNATVTLGIGEFDVNGTFLRQGAVLSASGPAANAGWVALSGTYTTGAGCAYVQVQLGVVDTAVAGTSAGATVWFDNAQVWNVTATGQTSMPYCELRFPQSPAQLLVSGLLGDVAAPAYLALGTYLTSWPAGSTLTFAVGRRAVASANAQLVAASMMLYGPNGNGGVPVLDTTSYGGYYTSQQVNPSGLNMRCVSPHPADALGTYHILSRVLTQQATGNLANIWVRPIVIERTQSWYGQTNLSDVLWQYYGPNVTSPIVSSNLWTAADAGQVALMPHVQGALSDPTQNYVTPFPQWYDGTSGGSTFRGGWVLLLPVDGSLVTGILYNPANTTFATAQQWLWTYSDGLGVEVNLSPAWSYSLESVALPNPAHAGGGPGNNGTGSISVNPAADAFVWLDPTPAAASINGVASAGVNQFAGVLYDQNAAVLPLHTELQYSPLYLYPR